MLTYIEAKFKGSSRKREQQIKQHETRTLYKFSNVKAQLKRSVFFFFVFCFKPCVAYCFPLIQNRS